MKVIITQSMAEDGINLLRYNPNFEVVVLEKDQKAELREEIKDADAIVVRSGVKVTPELLSHTNTLKIVGRAGAGYDNIDVDACSKDGIVVMIAPTGNTNGVVELTIGLLFALVRHIPKADSTMKDGVWAKKNLKGTELKDKTLGLVGLGKIGGRVAEIAQSLGMNVLALVKNKNKKRDIHFKGEFVDSLDDMLPRVDFLSLHVPFNQHTKHMIGSEELAKMKPSAYLVNTARGSVIDENALYTALKDGKINGAAVDVYSEEPASKDDFPFVELDNVIATPHLGASTAESQSNVSRIICQNLIEALESGIYIDAVNLPFSIAASDAAKYRPFIKLGTSLGLISGQYEDKKIKKIAISYRTTKKMEIRPIVISVCAKLIGTRDSSVSLINVEEYLNKGDVGLIIKQDEDPTFNNSLKLEVDYEDGTSFQVKGTYIAGVPKIVEVQNIQLEIVPAGKMLLVRNYNVPGVIGELGTLLGENDINIAEMHLGRSEIGGETKGALMIDTDVPENILMQIRDLEKIIDVKQINFE